MSEATFPAAAQPATPPPDRATSTHVILRAASDPPNLHCEYHPSAQPARLQREYGTIRHIAVRHSTTPALSATPPSSHATSTHVIPSGATYLPNMHPAGHPTALPTRPD